jgi:BMFP domain-containing protein YqiC
MDGSGGDKPRPDVPSGLLPALASRIDGVERTVAALAVRLDSLAEAAAGLQTTITDRHTELAAAIATATRAQGEDLDQHSEESNRLTAGVGTAVDALTHIVQDLIENLTIEVDETLPLEEDEDGEPVAEVDVAEEVAARVHQDLAPLTDAVVALGARLEDVAAVAGARDDLVALTDAVVMLEARVEHTVAGLRDDLAPLTDAIAALGARLDTAVSGGRDDLVPVTDALAALGARLDTAAGGRDDLAPLTEAVAALEATVEHTVAGVRDDLAPLTDAVTALGTDVDAMTAAIRDDMADLAQGHRVVDDIAADLRGVRRELSRRAAAAAPDPAPVAAGDDRLAAVLTGLAAVREEIAVVKRRVGLRVRADGRAGTGGVDHEVIASAVADRLADGVVITDAQLEQFADAVVARLATVFEVVDDDRPAGDAARRGRRR